MNLFNRKKLKAIEDRLEKAESGLIAITKHLKQLTQSNLYLAKLVQQVTTMEQQVKARDDAEAIMGQGREMMREVAKGDEIVADELWKKYGGQDLRKMDRMHF